MSRSACRPILVAIALASSPRAHAAASAAAAPADAGFETKACKTCHAGPDAKRVVHPAYADGDCSDCHEPTHRPGRCRSPVSHGWKLTKEPVDLCASCHTARDHASKDPLQHAPVQQGRCAECHDAHASDLPHLLRATGKELCLRCHDARRPAAKATIDLRRKHVHAALDVNDCAQCHRVAHGGSAPRFLVKPEAEICRECHEAPAGAKSIHTAVKQGRCTGCHDPHASDLPRLARRPLERLCTGCHDPDKQVRHPVEHAPVVEGRCHECHAPHAAPNAALLLETGSKLCLRCHDAKAPTRKGSPSAAARVDLSMKVVHPAVQAGECQDCHVAGHSGAYEHLLLKPAAALCEDCHGRKDTKRYTHGAVKTGECTGCHDPHAADQRSLLRTSSLQETCFRCHQDDLRRRKVVHDPVASGDCTACHDPHSADGRKLLTRGTGKETCYGCHDAVDRGAVRHAALRRYGCNGCHDAHGSANERLLPKKVNALCAVCHPDQRDGDHIVRQFGRTHPVDGRPDPRRKGHTLSCASCHEPHSSDHPLLFRSGDTAVAMCDGCHGNISGTNPGGVDLVRRAPEAAKSGDAAPSRGAPGAPPAAKKP